MKIHKIIILLIATFLIVSCQHDEPAQQGTVQFSFNSIATSNTGGRKQTDQIPDGASLIISLTKSNGDSVFTWKKIELLKVGDQFITSPLPLLQGSYVITDFMILGADNTLLFIAPKQGSTLAALVNKPIPIAFSVNSNSIANVAVEVVDANHKNPQDFGYASFPIKVIPGSGFSVSAFIANDNGQTVLTTAKAYILQGQDTILAAMLKASINNLNWIRQNVPYSLVIIKDGYARYQKNFSLDSLTTQLNGQPLVVVLKPAFTISWTPWFADDSALNIQLGGTQGSKIRIDWGDGTVQLYELNTDKEEVHHVYTNPVKYFFSVTENLSSINTIGLFYQTSIIDTMSIVHLPELQNFSMSFFGSYTGGGLDFSHNAKLASLDLGYTNFHFDVLDISKNPLLTFVDLGNDPQITTPFINKFIDDIAESAFLQNKRNGYMNLMASYPSREIVGHPSPEQVSKLDALVNDYGWTIYPIVLP